MSRFRYSSLGLVLVLFAVPLDAQQERLPQLNTQVEGLCSQGRFAEAEPLALEALRFAENAFGPDDIRLAKSLNDLEWVYSGQQKYPEAEAVLKRLVTIAEKGFGPRHPAVAMSLTGLSVLYLQEGRYAEAKPLDERALSIFEDALGPNDPKVADVLTILATICEEEGNDGAAEPLLRRALSIRENALGPEHLEVARALDELAFLYKKQGKYAKVEPLYQRALRIREAALGPDHPEVGRSLNALAGLYVEEGKYAQAEAFGQRALHVEEKAFGPEHPALASPLSTLVSLYLREGKYAEAEACYQRSLRIEEDALGAEAPGVGASLTGLAVLYVAEGKYAEAEPLLQRALLIQQRAPGSENLLGTAVALDWLANLYRLEGKYGEAVPLYGRALQMEEKILGPESAPVGTLLSDFASLRSSQGLPNQAEEIYERAFSILLQQFDNQFAYMSEQERLGFLATVAYRFPTYFSFVQQFHQQMPELAGNVYDLLLWEKGFIAGSVTALRRQVEASGDPEALKLLDQLAAKRTQIAALISQQPKDRGAWRKQIEQLEAEANDLEKQLVARSAAFAQEKKLERVTWQQVRDALKPGEAAVEFARFQFFDGKKWTDRTYYVALVVTPETKDQPQYVVLGEGKQLEGAPLGEFQQQVQARGHETGPPAAAQPVEPGARAYDLFWKPLEPALVGVRRIYLAPDGVLSQMPLGLIPAPGGKLLMERYDLRLLSSTKDLLRPSSPPASKTAVLIGDPDFALSATGQSAALAKLSAPFKPEGVAAFAPTDRSRDQGSGSTLPPLPGTAAEVQTVDRLLERHHWQASAYTGDRALEETLKQVHNPRVLHLATHGFFLPDQQIKTERMGLGMENAQPSGLEDPMLRSGLFFAGADRALAGQPTPDGLDDGVLTAYEATGLNLQGTELVVLSACNTGQGEVMNGEGVFGLRRALQEAGAQAVMMTLWSVPDKETQELMTLFYSKWLGGMEKHEALRQAQLEQREVVRRRYGADLPYYWGAFVLVGR